MEALLLWLGMRSHVLFDAAMVIPASEPRTASDVLYQQDHWVGFF